VKLTHIAREDEMKWTGEAEQAISSVPFFVRRRVRKRVEEEAQQNGSRIVTIEHVRHSQKKFLKNMDNEVKGYQVETCFGPGGCPNRAVAEDDLAEELEDLLKGRDLRNFLKTTVKGPLKMHHEFRVSLCDCPNACSRPQIADIGIIGAVSPRVTDAGCSRCGACQDVCRERAIELPEDSEIPRIDRSKCVSCGECVRACPTGALAEGKKGRRVLLGGKLGRHPQLGRELKGIHSRKAAMKIVDKCLQHYVRNCAEGERFGQILNRTGIRFLEE
jgi:anaerobic sulfite reductase subunit C